MLDLQHGRRLVLKCSKKKRVVSARKLFPLSNLLLFLFYLNMHRLRLARPLLVDARNSAMEADVGMCRSQIYTFVCVFFFFFLLLLSFLFFNFPFSFSFLFPSRFKFLYSSPTVATVIDSLSLRSALARGVSDLISLLPFDPNKMDAETLREMPTKRHIMIINKVRELNFVSLLLHIHTLSLSMSILILVFSCSFFHLCPVSRQTSHKINPN